MWQVVGTVEWNKNVDAVERAASGAKNICEAEASLGAVPRASRESAERAAKGAFGEPDDEHGVEQPDERSDAEERRKS